MYRNKHGELTCTTEGEQVRNSKINNLHRNARWIPWKLNHSIELLFHRLHFFFHSIDFLCHDPREN